MVIINQWGTDHVDYHSDPISIKEKDNKFNIVITGKFIASSENEEFINKLYYRLVHFIDKYKRDVDTFDTAREIEFMNNSEDGEFGSYFS